MHTQTEAFTRPSHTMLNRMTADISHLKDHIRIAKDSSPYYSTIILTVFIFAICACGLSDRDFFRFSCISIGALLTFAFKAIGETYLSRMQITLAITSLACQSLSDLLRQRLENPGCASHGIHRQNRADHQS